jgi:hypothetical protein
VEQKGSAHFELDGRPLERRGAFDRRIGHAPVDGSRVVGELGAHFSHAVAKRDHEVKVLRRVLLQMLGLASAQIDTAFVHDAYRQWMQGLGMAACAAGVDGSMGEVLQKTFRHLGSRAVARTEKQYSRWTPDEGVVVDRRWLQTQPWME